MAHLFQAPAPWRDPSRLQYRLAPRRCLVQFLSLASSAVPFFLLAFLILLALQVSSVHHTKEIGEPCLSDDGPCMHRFSGRFGFKAIIRIASLTFYNVTKQVNVRHFLRKSGVHKSPNYDLLFKHFRLSSRVVAVVTAYGCILRRVPVQAHPSTATNHSSTLSLLPTRASTGVRGSDHSLLSKTMTVARLVLE